MFTLLALDRAQISSASDVQQSRRLSLDQGELPIARVLAFPVHPLLAHSKFYIRCVTSYYWGQRCFIDLTRSTSSALAREQHLRYVLSRDVAEIQHCVDISAFLIADLGQFCQFLHTDAGATPQIKQQLLLATLCYIVYLLTF